MRAFLPFLLLISGLVTAHTSQVYHQARRAALGPRRVSKSELAPILARRRTARSAVKRSIVYKPGALKIAGFSLPSVAGPTTKKRSSPLSRRDAFSALAKDITGQNLAAEPQSPPKLPPPKASTQKKKPKKEKNGASRRKSQSKSGSKSKSSTSASIASSSANSTSITAGSVTTIGETYTGTATWYTQNGNAGACGTVSEDSDKVVALYTGIYDNGSNCGKMIQITNEAGTTIEAKVMDLCPSCTNNDHIDLSTGAFDALGEASEGVLQITWSFIESSTTKSQ